MNKRHISHKNNIIMKKLKINNNIFNNSYSQSEFTDCILESNDSNIFHVSRSCIASASIVLKEAVRCDKNPKILIDEEGWLLHLWLLTFHPIESSGTNRIEKVPNEYLSKLIPLYHKYDMKEQLRQCHLIIQSIKCITIDLINVISNTQGFEKHLENIFELIETGKITGNISECTVPQKFLIERIIKNKNNYEKRKKEIKKELETEFDEIVHLSLENMSDFEESDVHTEQFLNSFNSLKKHSSKK